CEMAERREDVITPVAADRAQDIACLTGRGVEAFHKGEIAVIGSTKQSVEVRSNGIGNGHCVLLKRRRPAVTGQAGRMNGIGERHAATRPSTASAPASSAVISSRRARV